MFKNINPNISVAGQISTTDVEAAAAAGFKAIICNRPDGEDEGQPPAEEIKQAALTAGMEFHYLPFTPGQLSHTLVNAFTTILQSAPSPVLAYCRSGTRSCTLWALGQAGAMPAEDILQSAANAGYDLSGIAAQLQR